MNNSSITLPDPKQKRNYPASFQDFRMRLLKFIMILASIAGIFALVAFLSKAQPRFILPAIIAYVLLLVAAFISIPYSFRAGILLAILFLMGVYSLFQKGISGGSPLLFLTFALLAAVLFDMRLFFLALALDLAALAVIGWFLITGRLQLFTSEFMVGSSDTWIITALVMLAAGLLLAEAWRRLRNEYLVSQETLKNAMNTLSGERAVVEMRVTERTRELASSAEQANKRADRLRTIAEILADVTVIQDLDKLLPEVCKQIGEQFRLYHVGIFLNDSGDQFTILQAAYGHGGERLLSHGYKLKIGHTGILPTVALTGEPHITERTKDDLSYDVNLDLPDTRSLMVLPLISNKHVIGVLDLESNEEGGLSEKDSEIMQMLANQVSAAIENARISDETRRALSEARLLYGQNLHQAWNQYSVEQQKIGYRFESNKIKPIEEPLELSGIKTEAGENNASLSSIKGSTIAVPLKLRGEVIGLLDVRSNNPDRQWTENELSLVRSIADRVALALENARLFEETTRRADREKTVSEITTRIRSTTDPQIMLQTALDELKRALGAKDIGIRSISTPQVEKSQS